MSRILVASHPMAGHVNPMLAVSESLSKRGHDIIFNTSELFREKVEARGLRFAALLGNANYDYRRLGELVPQLRTAAPGAELTITYRKYVLGDRIPDQYRGLRRILEEEDIDLVMTDVLFFGNLPLLLSNESRPPAIACGVIAPMWHDPAFSVVGGPDNTPAGRKRNEEDNRQFNEARAPGGRHIDGVLEQLGVGVPGGYDVANTMYRLPDLFLQFGAEVFEFPMYNRPANLRFTGPILTKQKEAIEPPEWLQELDGSKTVVFVTQGTLANFNFDQLVNPALAGLANDDVQLVVTAGGGDANAIVAPAQAVVKPYIPYDLLFPRTSVFVTNGGYNGVQQALSFGVPIVAVGASEDKPEVCSRVNWSGVGIGIPTRTPTVEQVRDAVREVLHNSSYRERAQALGASIAKTDALTMIAEIVDAAISGAVHKKASSAKGY